MAACIGWGDRSAERRIGCGGEGEEMTNGWLRRPTDGEDGKTQKTSRRVGSRFQDLICEGIRVEDVPTEGVFLQDFASAAHANHNEGPVVKGGEVLAVGAAVSRVCPFPFFIPGPINPGAFVQRVPSSELFGDLSVGLIHAGNKNASNSTRSPITSKTSMSVIPCFFMGIVFASQYAWLLSMIIQFDPIEKNFFAEFADGEEGYTTDSFAGPRIEEINREGQDRPANGETGAPIAVSAAEEMTNGWGRGKNYDLRMHLTPPTPTRCELRMGS
jgi:hypothetical protein